jgi:hypothetical protein
LKKLAAKMACKNGKEGDSYLHSQFLLLLTVLKELLALVDGIVSAGRGISRPVNGSIAINWKKIKVKDL